MQQVKNLLKNHTPPSPVKMIARNAPACPPPPEGCGGSRWFSYSVPIDHPYFGRLFPCPACNQIALDTACGLNEQERLITFDSMVRKASRPNSARMISAAEDFAKNPHGLLSIHGSYGNGKTMCLMAIVNAVIASGVEARYMTAADLLAYMRKAFSSDGKVSQQDDYDRLNVLARVPVLCIDEMDKLRDTPYSREIQQELINKRYRDSGILGTVLAWNGGLDALPFPAVISRAQEFTVIENNDADLRPLLGRNQ